MASWPVYLLFVSGINDRWLTLTYISWKPSNSRTDAMAVKKTWYLTSTETIRFIRDGAEKGGGEYGGRGRGRLYTYRYTVTTAMTPTLRWAAMRAILMFR